MARVTSGLGFRDTQAVHDRLRTQLWHQQDPGSNPGSATAGWVTGLFTFVCLSVLICKWGSELCLPYSTSVRMNWATHAHNVASTCCMQAGSLF